MPKKLKKFIKIILFPTLILISGCTFHSSLSSHLDKIHSIAYKKITYLGATAHIVTLDPQHYQVRVIKANTLEYPSVLAKKHKALVAINAGFFQSDGRPSGPLKIDNKWFEYPSSKNRGVLGWNNNPANSGEVFSFYRINNVTMNKNSWQKMNNIIGGIPLLLKDGKILNPNIEQANQRFIEDKHARSAFCVTKNHEILFIYVEGFWTPIIKFGMSIRELSQLLLSLRCRDGINFDGGHSSTLVINNKIIRNEFIFKKERKVSNILAVFPN